MAASEVRLIGTWSCPYVNRAQLALTLKSVDYEFVEDNAYIKSEMLLKYNPVHKKIPVLVHGERPVCESLVIVEYVDEAWAAGPPIVPPEARDRALARFWTAYIDKEWYPFLKVIRLSEDKEQIAALIQKISEGLLLLEKVFMSCSNGKAYFGGDNIGFLDIVLGCCLGWLKVTEAVADVELLGPNKTPGLAQWADRFRSDSAVRTVLPETPTLLELHHRIVAFIKSTKV